MDGYPSGIIVSLHMNISYDVLSQANEVKNGLWVSLDKTSA